MTVNKKKAKTPAAKTAKGKTGKATAVKAFAKKPVASMPKNKSVKSGLSGNRANQTAGNTLGKTARPSAVARKPAKTAKPPAPSSTKNKNPPKPKPPLSKISKAAKHAASTQVAKTGSAVKSKKKAAPVAQARGKAKDFHNVIISEKKAETVEPKASIQSKAPVADKGKTAPRKNAKARSIADKSKQFTPEELGGFYHAMLDLCKRLSLQVTELRQQSLLRHDEVNQDEDGTDAFERVTSLDRASADQSQIFQINNAIRAIKDGSYGLCDVCGEKIERSRLKALPFAKTCIGCQSQMENGPSRRRPTTDLWD